MSKALKVIPSLIAGLVFGLSFSGCALNWGEPNEGEYGTGFPQEGFEGYADSNQVYTVWAADPDFVNPDMELEKVIINSGEQSLKWNYDTGNSEWGDFLINETDMSSLAEFETLTFWVAGDAANEASNSLKLEVKNPSDDKILEKTVTEFDFTSSEWVQITIDLTQFDLEDAAIFVIAVTGTGTGIVYLDDIILE